MPRHQGRLELTWNNKPLRLLARAGGSYQWPLMSLRVIATVVLVALASMSGSDAMGAQPAATSPGGTQYHRALVRLAGLSSFTVREQARYLNDSTDSFEYTLRFAPPDALHATWSAMWGNQRQPRMYRTLHVSRTRLVALISNLLVPQHEREYIFANQGYPLRIVDLTSRPSRKPIGSGDAVNTISISGHGYPWLCVPIRPCADLSPAVRFGHLRYQAELKVDRRTGLPLTFSSVGFGRGGHRQYQGQLVVFQTNHYISSPHHSPTTLCSTGLVRTTPPSAGGTSSSAARQARVRLTTKSS